MPNSANPADVESIGAIIAACYDVISGPAGKKRDWERERSLFYPGARLIPTASIPGKTDVELAPIVLTAAEHRYGAGRGVRQYWHRSTRCQYFHMLSACHVSSFVDLARSSQSTSCGTMVIMALCAVQPPRVPARG